MALVIGKKKTRKIRVQIEEAGDFAEVKKHTVDVEFKVLSKSEVQAIRDLSDEKLESHDADLAVSNIFDSIISVDGLKDEAGNAVAYDDEMRQVMIDTPWISVQIMRGFWAVQSGISQNDAYKQAKLKN